MKRKLPLLVCSVALCLTGCETTHLSRRDSGTYPNLVLSLAAQPAAATDKLQRPIRLAVAQAGEPAPSRRMIDQLAADRALVSSIVSLPMPEAPRRNSYQREKDADDSPEKFSAQMESLRHLAQNLGADYILIFGGNIDTWIAGNALRALDVTIVGGALAPGNKIHAEGKATGALIDARNGSVIFLTNVEAQRDGLSPSFLIDGKTDSLRVELRDDLELRLAEEFLQTLANR